MRIIMAMFETSGVSPTISQAIDNYLRVVERARSKHTMLAYRSALLVFSELLSKKSLDPANTPVNQLTEDLFAKFINQLTTYAPTTEQLYLQAVKGFYLFLDSENFVRVNQSRLTVLIRQRSRRPGIRIPQFPIESIETLLDKVLRVENLLVPIVHD